VVTTYTTSFRSAALPQPVPRVTAIKAIDPPERIPCDEKMRRINIAHRVKTLFPGEAGEAAGQILYTAIVGYLELSYLGRRDAAMERLIAKLD
jgi:hypothetical protein